MRKYKNIWKRITWQVSTILTVILLLVTISDGFSQNTRVKPSRQSALEAFSNEKYEIAYGQFSELSGIYPKDPLYKYYCGVCLVKLSREVKKASSLLQEALKGSAVIRTIPDDCWFYLGRAQQMAGMFNEAKTSYNRYVELAGRKSAKTLGIPDYIQQCSSGMGQIAESENKPDEFIKNDSRITTSKEIIPEVKKAVQNPEEKSIKQIEHLPENYEIILSEALKYQFRSDSLNRLAGEKKKELEKLNTSKKAELKVKISEIERLAASYQKLANEKYSEAQKIKDANPSIVVASSLEKTNKPDRAVIKTDTVVQVVSNVKRSTVKDTIIPARNIPGPKEFKQGIKAQARKDSVNQQDARQKANPAIKKPAGAISAFEVVSKPVYTKGGKVEINPDVPAGLIYRIQIGIFRNLVEPAYFKGITPVYGIRAKGSDKTNYYAGLFRKSADAGKALNTVKAKGFSTAFVVAFFDNKQISSDRAKILEKEWGGRPLFTGTDVPRDTVPPTLLFRVEVMKTPKPLSPDVLANIQKIAGARGLDILTNENKEDIYLIGKFLTFESALEYSDLLVRNGFRNAKVVAYLGKKEIPVETAKQLFEK